MKRIFTILALLPSLSFAQLWENPTRTFPIGNMDFDEVEVSSANTNTSKSGKQAQTGIKAAATVGNEADEITTDISALARGLRYDAWNIYEYCVQHVKYQHYFGCKKGATATYLEGSGNGFDTAALMVALLRDSANNGANYTDIEYRFGMRAISYDEWSSWWGLLKDDPAKPTRHPFQDLDDTDFLMDYPLNGFPGTIREWRFINNATKHCVQGGFPWYHGINSGGVYYILVPNVWVSFRDETGTLREVDPSHKKLADKLEGLDLEAAMQTYSRSDFLSTLGGTEGLSGASIEGMNTGAIATKLEEYTTNLINHIQTNTPNASIEEVMGTQSHLRTQLEGKDWTDISVLRVSSTSYFTAIQEWTAIPEIWMIKLTVSVGNYDYSGETFTTTYTTDTITTASLQGKKISLTYAGNAGKVSLDEADWLTFTETDSTVDMKISMDHPFGTYDGNSDGSADAGDGTSNYVDNGSTHDNVESYNKGDDSFYVISYGFNPSGRLLRKRQEVLDAYRRDGLNGDSNEVATELLNVAGLEWLLQTELSSRLFSAWHGILPVYDHRLGRVGREEASGGDSYLYVDFKLQGLVDSSYDSNLTKRTTKFNTDSLFWSALEHSVIQDSVVRSTDGVSTVKIFDASNTGGQKIYRADSNNWNAGDNIRSILAGNGYTTGKLDIIENRLTQTGGAVLIHAQPTVTINQWDGSGYTIGSENSTGMFIGGNLAGGYVTAPIDISNNAILQFQAEIYSGTTYVDSGGADAPATYQSYNTPTYTGGDPVNLQNGSFIHDKSCLQAGGASPLGLSFSLHYNSNRRYDKSKGLGYGWTHNLDAFIVEKSSAKLGLGNSSPEHAAPFLVAMTIASDLYENHTTAKEWGGASLVANWAIEQLSGKAVSITMGTRNYEFLLMPDGSYAPPVGSTMTLSKDGSDNYILQERHGNTYQFDANNKLEKVIDPNGREATYTYSSGELASVTDAYGRTLTLNRSGDKINGVTETAGSLTRTISFTYTGDDLTKYTDPEGKENATYEYDSEHRITRFLDAKSRVITENTYDAKGRVIEQKSQGDTNKKWELFYSGYCNREVDPAGGEKCYFYDEKGRGWGVQDATGVRQRHLYDGQDHIVVAYKPTDQPFTPEDDSYNTEPATRTSYNGDHNPTQIELPERFAGDPNAPYIATREYDGQKRLWKEYDFKGNFTQYSYNTAHQVLTITDRKGITVVTNTYNPDGTLNTTADADSNVTTYSLYNAYGQAQTITYPAVTAGTYTEQFSFNERGDLLSQTDRRGETTSFTYNNRRQLLITTLPQVDGVTHTTINAYDDCGKLESVTDTRNNATSYTYNSIGQNLTTTRPSIAAGTAVITNGYDSRDWLETTQNALGNTTTLTYDLAQRVKTKKDPLNRIVENFYNGEGELIETKNAENESNKFLYNNQGERTSFENGLTHTVSYSVDKNGNRDQLTNRRNQTFQETHDANDRQLTLQTPLGNTATNIWNNRGLLGSVEEPSTDKLIFSYDELGRLEQTTVQDSGATISTINYTRDGNGNLTQVTEGGQTITRVFDERNRVESYTDVNGRTILYKYDGNNNLIELTYPSLGTGFDLSKKVTYTYNSHNQLKTVTDWDGRVTTYSYDLGGRMTQVDLPNGTSRRMAYDSAGQLIGMSDRAKGGTQQPISYCLFQYDNAGRIICETASPTPQTFTAPNITATYDNDNRLLTFNGAGITHDVDGNMTSGPLLADGNVTYNFDSRNRLTSVGSTSYSYDANETRLSVTEGGSTTTYVTDPNAALSRVLMRVKGGQTTYYIHGGGLLYQINPDSSTSTYHFDHLGSTVAISTDDGQTVEERVEYSPYGTIAYRESTFDTPFLFNGQYGVQTDANGLLYMRARYYNPYLKRFINQDPAGFAGGTNWFAYADGNPISYLDPFGLWSWRNTLGVIRAIGGVAETVAGVGLAVATGASGVGIVAGVAVAAHGIDQIQAGIREAVTGNQVDSFTSQGLQAAGVSQQTANIVDAGISIVGSVGSSSATASIRASQIAADDVLAQGLSRTQILTRYESGSRALNADDFAALGGRVGGGGSTPIGRAEMIRQGVDAAGDSYQLTTTFWQSTAQSVLLALGQGGRQGMGLTPLGDAVVTGGVGSLGGASQFVNPKP